MSKLSTAFTTSVTVQIASVTVIVVGQQSVQVGHVGGGVLVTPASVEGPCRRRA